MTWSLGYWVVERSVPTATGNARSYRGVDRRPVFPAADKDHATREQGHDSLLILRDRFMAVEEAGELHRDPIVALEVSQELARERLEVEVILAEVSPPDMATIPSDLVGHYEEASAKWAVDSVPAPPERVRLGIDVSYPFPTFHSAIRQPVLSSQHAEVIYGLNSQGLFDRRDAAEAVVARANATDTSWRPFCAVTIWLIDAAPESTRVPSP